MELRNIVRGAALPAILVLALLGALIAVVVLSGTVGGDDTPPEAPAFTGPEPIAYTALDVKQRSGDTFTLIRQTTSGTAEESMQFDDALVIERLALIDASGVAEGDWVTIVGVPDPVNNFAVHAIVVIPGGAEPGAGNVVRTAAGFAGHEVARDPRDRPIIGGVVLRIEENVIIIQGPTSEISIVAGPEAPARLYRVESAEVDDIEEGDRLAGVFRDGATEAILLLPGGAAG
jgi:hypothetical protein